MLGHMQGIGQSLGGRPRAKRFLLRVVGCPSCQGDDLEGRRQAAVGARVLLVVKLPGPVKDGASGGLAQAGGQGVGFAHGPQVMHQVGKVAVQHGPGQAVRHGQGKARALQQSAKVPDLAHGQDTGGQAARHFGLGLSEAGAQLGERLAPEHQPEEQPVRLQSASALNQLAHRIIRPMQAQGMDDQIMRRGPQRQKVVIRHHLCTGQSLPGLGHACHDHRRRKPSVNLDQSLLHFEHGIFVQKQCPRLACAAAVAGKGQTVCERRRGLHGREP
jgi:hypothetical protein